MVQNNPRTHGTPSTCFPLLPQLSSSLLRFTNFYQRFSEGFSHHTCLLFNLTKNNVLFCWTPEAESAFWKLQDQITSAPVLILLDKSYLYCLKANSLDFATGAVLQQKSQKMGSGTLLHSTQSLSWMSSRTTRSTTRSFSQSSELLRNGNTSSKAQRI